MLHKYNIFEAVAENYRRLASSYDDRWQDYNACQVDWVLQQLPATVPDGALIVDVGCGTGNLLARLAEQYPAAQLLGIDGSEDMLAVAREKLPSKVILETADLNDVGSLQHAVMKQTFDYRPLNYRLAVEQLSNDSSTEKAQPDSWQRPTIMTCCSVLHHLSVPKVLLTTMRGLLGNKGQVVFTDFAIDTLPMWLADRYFRLTQRYYAKGFSSKEMRGVLGEVFEGSITSSTMLQPDRFWRVWGYGLVKE